MNYIGTIQQLTKVELDIPQVDHWNISGISLSKYDNIDNIYYVEYDYRDANHRNLEIYKVLVVFYYYLTKEDHITSDTICWNIYDRNDPDTMQVISYNWPEVVQVMTNLGYPTGNDLKSAANY